MIFLAQLCHPEAKFFEAEGSMDLSAAPVLPASAEVLRFAQDDRAAY